MEGKRFGVGLAAGLLLGLVIVTATSGFTFGLYGSFSAATNNAGLVSSVTGAKSATTTSSQPLSPPSQNGSNSTQYTTNLSTTTGPPPAGADLASATIPVFSSHVANITQQPVLTNVIIFLPVFVAFLLGAVLYRISTKRRADSPETAR